MARRKNTEFRITPKILQNQLNTWQKKNPSLFKQIIGKLDMYGLITKRGKLTKNKRRMKYFERAVEDYKKNFGSYSSFMKRFSEKKIGLKRPKGMSKTEYARQAYEMTTSLEQFFKEVYDLKGREVAIEEYDYAKTLTITEYNDYVEKTLKKYRQSVDKESSVTSFDNN